MPKKDAPCAEELPDRPITLIDQVKDGVPQEGQQVEGEQQRRQILLPMPEVVFQMVAFGLEDVVVFVFDLPARPPVAKSWRG